MWYVAVTGAQGIYVFPSTAEGMITVRPDDAPDAVAAIKRVGTLICPDVYQLSGAYYADRKP